MTVGTVVNKGSITMTNTIAISDDVAIATINLINEYLFKGGQGHDADLLERMRDALQEADLITLSDATEQ
jgi:hypothetical protein